MGKGKKKIAGINRKTQTVFLSWSLFKASEVKRKSLSHIFLEGSEMELFLMLILIVLVPEILGGFQAEKIVCDYQMYYSPWILTPLSSYCTLLGSSMRWARSSHSLSANSLSYANHVVCCIPPRVPIRNSFFCCKPRKGCSVPREDIELPRNCMLHIYMHCQNGGKIQNLSFTGI